MKVTVDTNFLISATQWDYSVAHKLLKKFILSSAEIFTTQDILDETSEVLERDFEYSKDEAKNIIEKILLFVKLIEPKQKVEISLIHIKKEEVLNRMWLLFTLFLQLTSFYWE
jgi:predicted nucleic acid-binding protein